MHGQDLAISPSRPLQNCPWRNLRTATDGPVHSTSRKIEAIRSDFFVWNVHIVHHSSRHVHYFSGIWFQDFTALFGVAILHTNQTSECQNGCKSGSEMFRKGKVAPLGWNTHSKEPPLLKSATAGITPSAATRLCKSMITLQESLASWVIRATFQEFIC